MSSRTLPFHCALGAGRKTRSASGSPGRLSWGGSPPCCARCGAAGRSRSCSFSPPPGVGREEPLGALDKNLRFEMQVEIKEIQQRLGMTVLYVTHDQEEAMSMSDHIAIMNHGQIHQVGPPGEVYERPANA